MKKAKKVPVFDSDDDEDSDFENGLLLFQLLFLPLIFYHRIITEYYLILFNII